MSEEGSYHLVRSDEGVITLTIDRPAKRNALDVPLIEELLGLVARLRDDAGVRCLVVTGGGEKAFVAGADIGDLVDYTPETARHHIDVGHRLFTDIEQLPFPTIAAINGHCLGGGLELAMACDIRVASRNAKIGQPEIAIAMPCGWGGTARLQKLVGQSRAAWLMLTGELWTVDDAVQAGLVARAYDTVAEVRDGAAALAAKLAGFTPVTMRTTKAMIAGAWGRSAADVAQRDAALFASLYTTHDAREGLRAFLEKRPAAYEGR